MVSEQGQELKKFGSQYENLDSEQRVQNMVTATKLSNDSNEKSLPKVHTNVNHEVKYASVSSSDPNAENCPNNNGTCEYNKLESTVILVQQSGQQPIPPAVPEEEFIHESLLAFIFTGFNISFTIGIAYWHYGDGMISEANQTLTILFINAIVVQLAYAFNRNIKKMSIWKESKFFSILSLIPGTLTSFMSFADFVFSIKEAHDRSYIRPWTNTKMLYVAESLFLALPQAVLQSVILIQDPESIPKIKGLFTLFSLVFVTMSIAVARIRYDTSSKPDRFGTGVDKIIRWTIVWGNKGLWVSTFGLAIVIAELYYPNNPLSVIIAVAAILVLYEVPMILSSVEFFHKYIGKISGMFFLIPQFVSMLVLILWVNADITVYTTNVGICALGAFSGFECVVIIGWLLDGCTDREMDILPMYPHFFGDFYSSCCGRKQPKEKN